MKLTWTLLGLSAVLFSLAFLASCQTAPQSAGVIAAGIATAAEFVEALKPVLSPEMQAKLSTLATTLDGGMQSTVSAVGVLADAVSQLRGATDGGLEKVADGLQAAHQAMSELPSRTELWLTSGGVATATGGGAAAIRKKAV